MDLFEEGKKGNWNLFLTALIRLLESVSLLLLKTPNLAKISFTRALNPEAISQAHCSVSVRSAIKST